MSSEWLKGFNSNTNSLGEFPSKMVIVLPTLNMPAQFVLVSKFLGVMFQNCVRNLGGFLVV